MKVFFLATQENVVRAISNANDENSLVINIIGLLFAVISLDKSQYVGNEFISRFSGSQDAGMNGQHIPWSWDR